MVLVWKTIQEAQLQLKQSWILQLKGVVVLKTLESFVNIIILKTIEIEKWKNDSCNSKSPRPGSREKPLFQRSESRKKHAARSWFHPITSIVVNDYLMGPIVVTLHQICSLIGWFFKLPKWCKFLFLTVAHRYVTIVYRVSVIMCAYLFQRNEMFNIVFQDGKKRKKRRLSQAARYNF